MTEITSVYNGKTYTNYAHFSPLWLVKPSDEPVPIPSPPAMRPPPPRPTPKKSPPPPKKSFPPSKVKPSPPKAKPSPPPKVKMSPPAKKMSPPKKMMSPPRKVKMPPPVRKLSPPVSCSSKCTADSVRVCGVNKKVRGETCNMCRAIPGCAFKLQHSKRDPLTLVMMPLTGVFSYTADLHECLCNEVRGDNTQVQVLWRSEEVRLSL